MLKIRADHINGLAAQQTSGFIARMVLHLREVFTAEVARLDDAKLYALIAKICRQGEGWGITKEPLAERLIELFVSFEQLRRNPLPQWISTIITHPGANGARVLLKLENGLQFQESRTISTEPNQVVNRAAFYAKVDQAFYNEKLQANGGALPPDLLDKNGNARALTMSPLDRAYRRKWKAKAAEMRKSCAIPKKSIDSASIPWLASASGAEFPPVLLPSKGGAITKVAIMARQRPCDRNS